MGYLQCRTLSPGHKENGRIRNQAEIIFWFVKNILPSTTLGEPAKHEMSQIVGKVHKGGGSKPKSK